MTNHPNRSTSTRMRWRREASGSLTAIWPADSGDHAGAEWTFSRPGGGYVYCDRGKAALSGTLGQQICAGGGWRGCTIDESTDEGFVRAVKKWMADYRRLMAF